MTSQLQNQVVAIEALSPAKPENILKYLALYRKSLLTLGLAYNRSCLVSPMSSPSHGMTLASVGTLAFELMGHW